MTGFDPAELARLAEAATPGEWSVGTNGPKDVAVLYPSHRMFRIEERPDAEFIVYACTHRAVIVAALTRAQEAEKVIERVRAVHVRRAECGSTDCKDCTAHCEGCYEPWPCPSIAALGGATTTTGDTP